MWLDILIYLGFAIVLGAAIYFAVKNNISVKQIKCLDDILILMKFVNKQVDYPQQDDLEKLLDYCVALTNFLVPYVEKGSYDYSYLYQRMLSDAEEFCRDENIILNDELLLIIDMVADFIVAIWFGIEQ